MKQLYIYFLLISQFSFGSNIKNGYEALRIYDYFKAKQVFQKKLKKQSSPAAFGLATIYSRQDNPFHNLDSAYRYILIADTTFYRVKPKVLSELNSYGYSKDRLKELKNSISNSLFIRSKKIFTEESFAEFISNNPWSSDIVEAIHLRDSIAFMKAEQIGSSEAYQLFLNKYPHSAYSQLVKKSLDYTEFKMYTKEGMLSSYLDFIKVFPLNYYTSIAEDSVFSISTKELSISNLYNFIRNNPTNKNVTLAWKKLSQLYIKPYGIEKIERFILEYPDYPFVEALELEKQLLDKMYYPYKRDSLYGWMDETGKVLTPPLYEYLSFYSEGLALSVLDGKYGFIDKSFQIVVPFKFDLAFDFENGLAQVVISGKYGVIDKLGNYILKPEFDEISSVNEFGIVAKKNSMNSFFNSKGEKLFEKTFDDAYGFERGLAKVVNGDYENYINQEGEFIFQSNFLFISRITDSIFVFQKDSLFGLIDFHQKVIQEPIYSLISSKQNDGLILFQVKDKIGFFDLNGKVIIPAKFDVLTNVLNLYQFKSGFAKVSHNHKWGVINTLGKWVVLPLYKSKLGEVSELVFFEKEGKFGCINLSNEVVVSPKFSEPSLFINGISVVKLAELYGAIDLKGKFVLPVEFTFIQNIEGKLFITRKNDYFSIFNSNGELLTTKNYLQARILNKDLIMLTSEDGIEYFSISNIKLISVIN